MKPHSIQLIYFSPTHTSRNIAKAIAQGIQLPVEKEINLTYPSKDAFITIENTLTIIVVPTYAGRISETALERLHKIHTTSQTPAIIAVLYGNRDYEDALIELRDTVKELGFIPISGGAFIGEHSYSTSTMPIAPGRPDPSDLQIAKTFGRKSVEQLSIYTSIDDIPLLRVKGNIPYKERKPKTPASPETIKDLCTQCGFCIEICPVEAIQLKDEITSNDETCIKCCACVKQCPSQARIFNTPFTEFLFKNFHDRKEPETFIVN